MKFKFIILLFGIFLLTSSTCEQTFDIETLQEPKLVLNCAFSPHEPMSVSLSASRPIISPDSRDLLGGSVSVVDDNNIEFILNFDDTGFKNQYINPGFVPQVGVNYEIRASAPNVEPVNSNNTIPEAVQVISASFDSTLVETSQFKLGQRDIWINVAFQLEEKPGDQFYHFYAYRQSILWADTTGVPDYTFQDLYFHNDLIDLNNSSGLGSTGLVYTDNSLLFKDDSGSSNFVSFDIGFTFPHTKEAVRNLRFELRTVSEEYYKFHVAKRKQELVNNDEFAEPIISFSNIEGGLGLFGGYNTVLIDSLIME